MLIGTYKNYGMLECDCGCEIMTNHEDEMNWYCEDCGLLILIIEEDGSESISPEIDCKILNVEETELYNKVDELSV